MKQMTQNKLLKILEEEKDQLRWDLDRTKVDDKSKRELLQARIDAYDKVINTLNSVEIVPESGIKAMVHCEAQSLNDVLGNITMEPCDEPQRNDRFRDFEKECFYVSLDAKEVKSITMCIDNKYETIEICVDDFCVKRFTKVKELSKQEAIAYYKDLIEWRNYWKQN